MKKILSLLLILIGIKIHAQTLTLIWDENKDPFISGYKLYLGSVPNKYYRIYNIKDPHTTNITIEFKQLIRGATNYFALSAYNNFNLESEKSDELSLYIYNKPFYSPTAIEYQFLDTNTVYLKWKNIELKNPVNKYLIEYKNSFFDSWKNLLTTNTNNVTVELTKPIVYYRISSGNDLGFGPTSDAISITKK